MVHEYAAQNERGCCRFLVRPGFSRSPRVERWDHWRQPSFSRTWGQVGAGWTSSIDSWGLDSLRTGIIQRLKAIVSRKQVHVTIPVPHTAHVCDRVPIGSSPKTPQAPRPHPTGKLVTAAAVNRSFGMVQHSGQYPAGHLLLTATPHPPCPSPTTACLQANPRPRPRPRPTP